MPRSQRPSSRVTVAHAQRLLRHPFDGAGWTLATASSLHVRIGNAPTAIGQAASLDALASLFARCDEIGCQYFDAWELEDVLFVETDMCVFEKRTRRELPCLWAWRSMDAAVLDVRVYLDPSGLRAPMPARPA